MLTHCTLEKSRIAHELRKTPVAESPREPENPEATPARLTLFGFLADHFDLLLGFVAGGVSTVADDHYGLLLWARLDYATLLVGTADDIKFRSYGRNRHREQRGDDYKFFHCLRPFQSARERHAITMISTTS
jgi:hypothetical protein